MKKFICCPQGSIPKSIEDGVEYFSLYSSLKPKREKVGHVAIALARDLRRASIVPTIRAWDFSTICLSVAAADMSVKRSFSADGWTRQIELDIHLCEPEVWSPLKKKLELTLRFLSGDFWGLNFLSGGVDVPVKKNAIPKIYDATCVSLLSGGLDSLVGAIDLVTTGEKPLFVSKIAQGDKEVQKQIACCLDAKERHLQWSFARRSPNESETSTRARSIIFIAYGILAASAIENEVGTKVPIYIPENGFISLNLPLNPGRMGSLSTKTTHPVYISGLQEIMNAVGIDVELQLPFKYQWKTKGELLAGCLDKKLLGKLGKHTTSCGRYLTYKRTHCGRCVPCLVRRAAFMKSGLPDNTAIGATTGVRYHFENLTSAGLESGANDIGAMAKAYLQYKENGIESFIGGGLAFAESELRQNYVGVVERGLKEIGELLSKYRIV